MITGKISKTLKIIVFYLAIIPACEKAESEAEYRPSVTDNGEETSTESTPEPDKGKDSDTLSDLDSASVYDDPETCAETHFKIEVQTVDMLIVLDRSNSMKQDGLWGPMGVALSEVTAKMEQKIDFGLIVFPALSCNGLVPSSQCNGPTNAKVNIGDPDAAAEIALAVGTGGVGTCGGTPTAATLGNALDYLSAIDDKNRRFVLLATDGAPNCNSSLDCATCTTTHLFGTCANSGQCLDDAETVIAAKSLYDAGFPVYVIGMGGSTKWATVMNSIAAAGGTGSYYAVSDTSQLLNTLENITGKVVSCEFEVKWDDLPPGASADPSKVNFYCKQTEDEPANQSNLIGFDKDCQNGSGWNWVDDDTVVFCPGVCEELKKHSCPIVTATFGCVSVPVQ